jgi:hypothetical protein
MLGKGVCQVQRREFGDDIVRILADPMKTTSVKTKEIGPAVESILVIDVCMFQINGEVLNAVP